MNNSITKTELAIIDRYVKITDGRYTSDCELECSNSGMLTIINEDADTVVAELGHFSESIEAARIAVKAESAEIEKSDAALNGGF